MRGQGRRTLVAFAVGIIAAGTGVAGIVTHAGAATAAPTLSATMTSQGLVKLAWKFSSAAPRDDLQLEIDRGTTATNVTKLFTVTRPRGAAYRYDKHPLSGTSFYRARLVTRGVISSTSAVVKVSNGTMSSTNPSTIATTTTVKVTTTTKATTTTTVPTGTQTGPCATARADVLKLVNAERAKVHVAALKANTLLDKAAQKHSDWMGSTGTFSHDGWVAEIQNAGYKGGFLGQNIAGGQGSAASAMSAWMASAGHKANILNAGFKDLGVGCANVNKGYHYYWTQDFGG